MAIKELTRSGNSSRTKQIAFARSVMRENLYERLDPLLELDRLKRIQVELLAVDELGDPIPIKAPRMRALKLASENSRFMIGKYLPTPQSLDINGGAQLGELLDQMTEEERLYFGVQSGAIEAEFVEVDDEEDPLK